MKGNLFEEYSTLVEKPISMASSVYFCFNEEKNEYYICSRLSPTVFKPMFSTPDFDTAMELYELNAFKKRFFKVRSILTVPFGEGNVKRISRNFDERGYFKRKRESK